MIFQLKCLFTDRMGTLQTAPNKSVPGWRHIGLSNVSTKASAERTAMLKMWFILVKFLISFHYMCKVPLFGPIGVITSVRIYHINSSN